MYTLKLIAFACVVLFGQMTTGQNQTVYEYYGGANRDSGLTANHTGFFLNGKELRIMSGAMHYFRIHPDYWRDRMRRLRASGANTLETYVPWNLHEPRMGYYDFGNGTEDMSLFLNVRRYVQMAQEEDLLVIFRPGPYICSEWDYGGLPSWLQRIPGMQVRTSTAAYQDRVHLYFTRLMPQVADLTWTNGGPIIMVQVENEYGAFGTMDKPHLEWLKTEMETLGLNEMFVTSDSPLWNGDKGAIPGVLQSANFQTDPDAQLDALLRLQPDKPALVMEYWSGWFTHWMEPVHGTTHPDDFAEVLERIYQRYNGSVNYYMFHGGTNFGFMAGANHVGEPYLYLSDVTSYDYDAPLSENGDYNEKYHRLRTLNERYAPVQLHRPEMPEPISHTSYGAVTLQNYLDWDRMVDQIPTTSEIVSNQLLSMEMMPINGGSGQSYGYILYRKRYYVGNGTKVKIGRARDLAMCIVDGRLQSKGPEHVNDTLTEWGYWVRNEQELNLNLDLFIERNVDILVENMARVNFGTPVDYVPQKGLQEGIFQIDGVNMTGVEIKSMEFKSSWVRSLTQWRQVANPETLTGPLMIQSTFWVDGAPKDTWLDMSEWHKGIVFINGFNLGRYFKLGPPQTLYVPAPLLKNGTNTITIFEQFRPAQKIQFTDTPYLGPVGVKKPLKKT